MCPGEQAQHIFRIQGDPCLEKPDLPESQVRPAHLKTTCLLPSTNFSPPPPPSNFKTADTFRLSTKLAVWVRQQNSPEDPIPLQYF